ncbi:ABC transporter permease [Algicella marina]|uniref:FtsX-like permease family protein n=1 Tax=Algicella marina TaxID=2683284 RepID=A0A6P1T1P0_9RHOB|nr:ABC transporter permease [Algicella marina]QHQ35563.1 FtsX-like permease family protein [Algicella marina]
MPDLSSTKPFSRFEWQIAWKYLRARRKEGGVSIMSIISLVGVALAVFALIVTLAIRSGFRTEFVDAVIGANAHITVYAPKSRNELGGLVNMMTDFDGVAERAAAVPGVTRAAPIIVGQVMASANGRNAGVEVFGEKPEDLMTIPFMAEPEETYGDPARFSEGVAMGAEVAFNLGLQVGDFVTIISPEGTKLPFGGTSPRVGEYEVVYIFRAGHYQTDNTRIYMPFGEAQSFFDREGVADQIEVFIDDPEAVDAVSDGVFEATGGVSYLQTWKDRLGRYLRALQMEDNVMFILLSILVLVASLNIVSGLVMLVKNKGRDIGILRTMGLTEGSVLRIFFICGAAIGLAGTAIGVITGCLFAIYIDPIFDAFNYIVGGGAWDPSVRMISELPAELKLADVLSAMALSLGLSFTITYFPARRAARMNPVEALRYE